MSFAVDTNVLLRTIDDGHAAQTIAQEGLFALRDRGEMPSIFPQNLIEFWAVATRPVVRASLHSAVLESACYDNYIKTALGRRTGGACPG